MGGEENLERFNHHHVGDWDSLLLLLALENIQEIRNVILSTMYEIEMKGEGEDELRNVYTTSYSGQISPASKRNPPDC